jgi:serine/threonine-protein kinase haspin
MAMDDLGHGVQVTIIDLGLSRMDAGDGSGGHRVQWTPFDEEIFMGKGELRNSGTGRSTV